MSSIWDTIINRPLGWIIEISYRFTHNYAIALFIFALVLQIVLFPLGIKQQKNSVKQASLRPKEMAIRKKYAGRNDKPTQQKLNEEIMELYQRENFNPMGGCLPMLIQLPILFSLYNVVISPLKYICGFGAETIKNIQLKVYEILQAAGTEGFEAFAEGKTVSQINLITKMRELGLTNFVGENGQAITESMLPDFTIFGGKLDLSMIPIQHLWSILLLIPALTLVVTYGSTWISRKLMYNPNPEAQNDISMKIMNLSMPLLSVYISFTVPATIGLTGYSEAFSAFSSSSRCRRCSRSRNSRRRTTRRLSVRRISRHSLRTSRRSRRCARCITSTTMITNSPNSLPTRSRS